MPPQMLSFELKSVSKRQPSLKRADRAEKARKVKINKEAKG
jgi:hypothetical protein